MALESPAMAGAAFLVPGLANGNARLYTELAGINRRLDVVEAKVDRVLRGCNGEVAGARASGGLVRPRCTSGGWLCGAWQRLQD